MEFSGCFCQSRLRGMRKRFRSKDLISLIRPPDIRFSVFLSCCVCFCCFFLFWIKKDFRCLWRLHCLWCLQCLWCLHCLRCRIRKRIIIRPYLCVGEGSPKLPLLLTCPPHSCFRSID